jgi:glycosyltransferase involved in cell wall biosynthesis
VAEALRAEEAKVAAGADDARALADRLEAVERRRTARARIPAVEQWVAAAPRSDMLVSVIMPTRDRSALLVEAIASVQAQVHEAWELLIVDDGSTDDTAAVLSAVEDPRVRVLSNEGRGETVARNLALDHARGEAIAYLDDDNTMLPLWLASIAWAFERHPEHDTLYGGRVMENLDDAPDLLPDLQFEPFDRETLRLGNYMDTNVLAHRRGLAQGRWDESVDWGADWELAFRLVEDHDPLALPVRAVLYATAARDRVSTKRPSAPFDPRPHAGG